MAERQQFGFLMTDQHSSSACPNESVWFNLANSSDAMSREESLALLAHAAECDHCGPRLRNAVRSSQPLPAPAPGRWWWAAAAMLVLTLAGGFLWFKQQKPDPLALLAKSASQQRPFPYRIPGVDFAPVTLTRGPSSAGKDLLAAQIALSRLPSRPDLERPRALLALLTSDPSAPELYRSVLALTPNNPDLITEYAISLALADQPQAAIAQLESALQLSPTHLAALFNLALLRQQIGSPAASSTWQRYLSLDPNSPWANEARRQVLVLSR